jgi:mRNA interferase MazF
MNLKIFDQWNEKKKVTHQRDDIPAFRVRDIWWARIGKNIASESLGKGKDFLRPVIILQKFYGSSALAIPLTSQKKKGNYYFPFRDSFGVAQTAILSQIRYIDGRRLRRKSATIDTKTFQLIQDQFFKLIKNNPQSS